MKTSDYDRGVLDGITLIMESLRDEARNGSMPESARRFLMGLADGYMRDREKLKERIAAGAKTGTWH
ncbi:hypothetical protein [uncultured Desulfovibrio sp.]|uniref:hypothetical protein n=1 Tax=uncultured Desulfovibrio sp. TaxID=167968 RepID=UPI00263265B7|nr:hypothetical protein [uncultured Desulfovibrio sp.]